MEQKLALRGCNYIDKTSELILSACPTEVKKRLNSSATVLSSLLNDLWLVDFLGIHDLLNWSTMDSRSVCLISLLTLRLRLLYFIQASGSPVLLANFRQYFLIFISSLTLSLIYRFSRLSDFIIYYYFFFGVCSSRTSLNKRLNALRLCSMLSKQSTADQGTWEISWRKDLCW